MASRDNRPFSSDVHEDAESSSSSHIHHPDSTSSHDGQDNRSRVICPWRTPRYYNQECSRYFDCPTHTVERALSEDAEEEREDETTQEARHDRPQSGMSTSDDTGNEDGPQMTDPGPPEPRTATTAGAPSHPPQLARSRSPPGSSAGNPIMLDAPPAAPPRQRLAPSALSESQRGSVNSSSGGVSTSPAPVGSLSRQSRVSAAAAALSQAASQAGQSSSVAQNPVDVHPGTPVVLPRWQPDAEATYCPICHTQFSIFNRKHHCRKCGRVVCASCSPHRITIPHQYIVRPPGSSSPVPQRSSSSSHESHSLFPDFSGGERVRLCNPCVPDPNTAPPFAQQGHSSQASTLLPSLQPTTSPTSNRWNYYFGAPTSSSDPLARNRSATMSHPTRGPPSLTSGGYAQPSTSYTHNAYPGYYYQSMLNLGEPSSAAASSSGPSSSTSALNRQPLRSQPEREIPEEDECPVCHRELPPRTLPDFEARREQHINDCIAARSNMYNRSRAASSSAAGESSTAMPRPRYTRMFPYTATEKDCVDDAECTICLEEFEVGAQMARLECLCRFHLRCINAWWERHPGRCPMHQHDGYGY
ncbi:putative E3 ubiquitin-protein [Thermochaetoides thermophila DSM 1495]|uniref:RING-type E3 ubiquitin transferase n=1 Tax=Chaetomium thermophilum (strain DSM 1495 / CBS 144.50 / IMI 039719) TaxID=759272 RepID=G0SCN1_CHATD|nr:putative E3 ubiquitin-protein [Thermochaetoides thermophila DSM 1495]EGS19157.1 putative E3 ubiquitin-protein [Thermochaetoides thermophila DSM 1495]